MGVKTCYLAVPGAAAAQSAISGLVTDTTRAVLAGVDFSPMVDDA